MNLARVALMLIALGIAALIFNAVSGSIGRAIAG